MSNYPSGYIESPTEDCIIYSMEKEIERLKAENAALIAERDALKFHLDNYREKFKNADSAHFDIESKFFKLLRERDALQARIDGGIRVYIGTYRSSGWNITEHIPIDKKSNSTLIPDEGVSI